LINEVKMSSTTGIILDPKQKEAIASAFEYPITVIVGPAGSGKSLICRFIYQIANEHGLSVSMMSPTGKAAQNLAEKTGGSASTIHRSLKMTPEQSIGREDIIQDIVIIDEISMVGMDTAYPLLYAMRNSSGHLILVGDSNQLPSVSPGNILSDIIRSGCAHVVMLDTIHRQDAHSYIPVVANEIAKGKVTDIPSDAKDITWYDINENTFPDDIRNKVQEFIDKNELDNLQVIAPMYRGECGINNINAIIQELVAKKNNITKSLKKEGSLYYVGDRVIQTENDYKKMIYNGDMGIVKELGSKVIDPSKSDEKTDYIVVEFNNKNEITFYDKEISQIKVAWCCSVHKFQGSQCPTIIFVMPRQTQIMINKELVYTALTRAEKQLIIYGDVNLWKMAPHKSDIKTRFTNLDVLISGMQHNKKMFQILGEQS